MREIIDRWLMLRPGEGRKTAYFLLLNVILGIGMAIGRASSEALFFSRVGVDALPLLYILLSIALLVASLIYAAFVDRWSAERLMRGFAITLLVLLFANGALIQFFEGTAAYYGYFLLYELVSEILIIHMAHYLGQNLDLGQGKRLMPTILAGTQIGMVVGGVIVATLSGLLAAVGFVYLWAGAILVALLLLQWWHRRMGHSPYFYPKPQQRATLRRTAQEIGQGARAIWTIPLARASAVSMFLLVIAFYLLNYAVNKVYVGIFSDEQQLVAFFGWLNAGLSLAAIVTQMLLSNRVIEWLGIKQVSLLYPIGNVVSFIALLLSFSLLPALLGSITRGVLMPAFFSPTNNLIHSIMSRRMQGRVRAALLGLVMPVALVLCGVVLDQLVKGYPFELILWLGAAVSLLYVGSNLWRNRSYHQELVASLKDGIFLRNIERQGGRPDHDIMTLMANNIDQADADSVAFFVEMMASHEPCRAARKIADLIPYAADPLRDRLLNVAIDNQLKIDSSLLADLYNRGDEHLQATVMRLLSVSGDELADKLARTNLTHHNPRIRVESMRHQLRSPGNEAQVVPLWQEMFDEERSEHALAMLAEQLVRLSQPEHLVTAYQQLFVKMLSSADERTVATALAALGRWPFPISVTLAQLLERQLHGKITRLRQKGYRCLGLLPEERAVNAAWQGMEENHHAIRQASLAYLQAHGSLTPDSVVLRLGQGTGGHPRQVNALLEYVEDKVMPRAAYETISEGLLTTAQHFAAAGAWIAAREERANARGEVLLYTLQERFHQMLDAAIAALQGCENREELRIVRAVLASGDNGSRARAGEVIYHIRNRDLARRLMEAIDRASNFHHCMQGYRPLFASSEEALEWCYGRNDRWLSELVAG